MPIPRRRRWRDYQTLSGRRPVADFIGELSDIDAAAVVAAMREITTEGLQAARHLKGDVYEVRADGDRVIYRILFSAEGRRGQVLLALEGFKKKTQATPPEIIRLAERRLKDWRSRGTAPRI
jgi:phage-related protein